MDIPPELVEAKRAAEFGLLALPGVNAVGLGMREENGELFDELSVVIYVEDMAQVPDGLPERIGDVGVCIVERSVEPCGFPDVARYPDVRGGIAIRKPHVGTGTLGAVVVDAQSLERLGLSCFHVTGDAHEAFPHSIWQPDNPPIAVGVSIVKDDNLGGVERVDFPQTAPLPFSPILAGMSDAALIHLDVAAAAGRLPSPAIADQGSGQPNLVGAVTATADLNAPGWLPHRIRKRGFATGPTNGLAYHRFLTVNWEPGGPNAFLIDQVAVLGDGVFCDQGDSGSLVLEETGPTAVGLLWGRNKQSAFAPAGKTGYFTEIRTVQAQLGFSMVWP
ncbi:hypothetical protein [Streptomyces decoyicus]|uniref:hypothetical protein n=1 Tax=Streptomyces decoyicus TaxID=249567 RepID=UPI0033A2B9A2